MKVSACTKCNDIWKRQIKCNGNSFPPHLSDCNNELQSAKLLRFNRYVMQWTVIAQFTWHHRSKHRAGNV